MRVLIINTSEKTGGAAVAANRLMDALNNNGVKAKMLVRDKETDDITVAELTHPWIKNFHFLWERWCVFWHLRFHRKNLFAIDVANSGFDVTKTREFQEADIIHLHWINQGMLSLKDIRKIVQSGKPVVWTMHDIWPATAICHYTRGCERFKEQCQYCPMLPGGGSRHDLAYHVWQKKVRALGCGTILFVTCSKWLANQAKQSRLLRGQQILQIPNPIDTRIFRPMDRAEARRRAGLVTPKRIILFVSQRVTDKRKGLSYFIEALQKLADQHPDMRDDTAVAILGGHADEVGDLPFETFPLGYVNEAQQLAAVYSAADVFALPSLEDNLPNTIMEALACGVPCVAFNVGGIPEMIDHQQNGYVARYRDADDLAAGLHWVLRQADHAALSQHAVRKVNANYSQQSVAMSYIEAYNQASALRHYRL